MAQTYYARARVAGTNTPQCVQVEAGSTAEAKRLMEARIGKIKSFANGPVTGRKPPVWYR